MTTGNGTEIPTRTVLAINPSHSSPLETEFWTNFAKAAHERSWTLVQVAARVIPELQHTETIILPARLWEFAARMRSRPSYQLHQRPEWLSQKDLFLQVEWEHRRWDLPSYTPSVVDGVLRLAWYADEVIRTIEPGVILTTNKIDHPCALFRAAGLHHGVDVGLIERSPFDSIWYEPDGIFTESRIWHEWAATKSEPSVSHGKSVIAKSIANPAGFRLSPEAKHRLPSPEGPLVFLPFDNLLWTGWTQAGHPQGQIDNPMFATPQEGLNAVSKAVDRLGGTVILKAHPACLETDKLKLPSNVEYVDAPLDALIDHTDITVAFNTKVAFLSLAMGKPTATLANNPAAASGLTHHWKDSTLETAIKNAMRAAGPNPIGTARFFSWLDTEYFYGVADRAEGQGPSGLAERLFNNVDASARELPAQAVDDLRDLSEGAPKSGPPAGSDHRPKLVLDVSRLVDMRLQKSGIARYQREILTRLTAKSRFETWAVVHETSTGWPKGSLPLFEWLHSVVDNRVIPMASSPDGSTLMQRIGELRPTDVFHSLHHPLPQRAITGEAQRVLTIHDVLHVKFPKLYEGSRPAMIEKVLDSIDVHRDYVVGVSDQTRRDVLLLKPMRADRVSTVLSAVSPPARPRGDAITKAARQTVMCMLQNERRKNTDAALQALGMVLEEHGEEVDVTLVMTRRDYPQNIKEMARLGLPKGRIRVLLEPEDEELFSALQSSHIFLFSSLYEGFGFPPLEAIAAGCAVVVPLNSSLSEVVGPAGYYAASGQAEHLRDALRIALANGVSASRRAAMEGQVKKLNWDRTTAGLVDVYSRVTKTTRASTE